MNQRKPKKAKRSAFKFSSPEEQADYEKLVADISGEIDALKAKGIDPFPRTDTLTCRSCGAYEDVSIEGVHFIAHKDGRPVKDGLGILLHPEKYPADAVDKLCEGLSLEEAEKKMRSLMDPESFILIDSKGTTRAIKDGKVRCRMKYSFICSVCGAEQMEEFTEDFDPKR